MIRIPSPNEIEAHMVRARKIAEHAAVEQIQAKVVNAMKTSIGYPVVVDVTLLCGAVPAAAVVERALESFSEYRVMYHKTGRVTVMGARW